VIWFMSVSTLHLQSSVEFTFLEHVNMLWTNSLAYCVVFVFSIRFEKPID